MDFLTLDDLVDGDRMELLDEEEYPYTPSEPGLVDLCAMTGPEAMAWDLGSEPR